MNLKWIIVVALAVLAGSLWLVQGPWSSSPERSLNDSVLVAQGSANQIAVVDLQRGDIGRIDVGPMTHGVAVQPGARTAYASSFGSENLSVVDLDRSMEMAQIDIGGNAHHLAVSPDGRWVLATVGSNDTVAVVNPETQTLERAIPVAKGPGYAVVAPDGRRAYVTNMGAGVVSVIDLERLEVAAEIPVGQRPDHLAITPDGRRVYVTNGDSDDVSVIDTESQAVAATIPVEREPHGVAVIDRNDKLAVAVGNRGETTLSLIDPATNRVTETIDLGVSPEHLTASSDRRLLYVGSVPAQALLVVDPGRGRVLKRIDVGGEIHQLAIVGAGAQPSASTISTVPKNDRGYRDLDADQFATALERSDVTLINVHVPYEGELPQTDRFIPFDAIEENAGQLPTEESAPIAVYCRSGSMSAVAAETLVELGYTNVLNLDGGMRAWEQSGRDLQFRDR